MHSYVWRDSFIYVTWLIHTNDMTHAHECHDSFIRVIWLHFNCDMTPSYVWHDTFVPVTWLMHTCGVTHLYVWLNQVYEATESELPSLRGTHKRALYMCKRASFICKRAIYFWSPVVAWYTQKNPVYPLNLCIHKRAMNFWAPIAARYVQKSPVYPLKRSIYPQKSSIFSSLIVDTPREPFVPAKEPCRSAKELYKSVQEPYMFRKSWIYLSFHRCEVLPKAKWAPHIRKRTPYIRERALCIWKWAVSIRALIVAKYTQKSYPQ